MNVQANRIRALTVVVVTVATVAIVALGAALRVWGIGYGIPHPTARPDEERLVGRAQTIFATGNWHPGSFYYPSLPFYLETFALYAYYGGQKLSGTYEKPLDFLYDAAVTRPGLHYLVCRSVSVAAGVGTILAALALSLAAYGRSGGALLAAGFVAVAHLHVRDSHFATVDVLATFFVTVALVFSVRAACARHPTRASFVLAGLATGLAISSKYNTGLVALAVLTAALLRGREGRSKLALSALMAFVAFAVTSPYVLLRLGAFWSDMSFLREFLYGSPGSPGGELAFWDHLSLTLPYGLGWPLFAASALGLARALWLRRPADLVLLSFAIPFLALVSSVRLTFPRYLLPVIPLLLVLAAELVASLAEKLPHPGLRLAARPVLGLLLAIPTLSSSMAFDRIAARSDTRIEAADFLARQFQPRTRILLCRGYGAPPVNVDRRRPPAFLVEEMDCLREPSPPENARFLVTHELEELSSFSRVNPALAAWLDERAELLATFSPYRPNRTASPVFFGSDAFYIPYAGLDAFERGGPVVKIWRLPEPETELP